MAYTTEAKIANEISANTIIQLTDDDKDGTGDAGVITQMILKADTYIDARLNSLFPDMVPFTTTPAIIDQISVLLSAYFMAKRRHAVSKTMQARKDEADELLNQILNGNLSIPEIHTARRFVIDSNTYNDGTPAKPQFELRRVDTNGNVLNDKDGTMETW